LIWLFLLMKINVPFYLKIKILKLLFWMIIIINFLVDYKKKPPMQTYLHQGLFRSDICIIYWRLIYVNFYFGLIIDGKLGPKTIAVIKKCLPVLWRGKRIMALLQTASSALKQKQRWTPNNLKTLSFGEGRERFLIKLCTKNLLIGGFLWLW